MRAVVTGNKGFIGKAFFNYLMTSFDAKLKIYTLDDITEKDNWQFKIQDFLVEASPDVIFHIGACSDTQNFDVQEMMAKNVETTMILAAYCDNHEVPMIYSSSASCYGNGSGPLSLYAWSKYIGEQFVLKCGGVALRYFNVFGYDEAHKGNMASFPYQAYQAHKRGEKVLIFPSKSDEGRPRRDFVYVQDVISANLHAYFNYPSLRGNYYDVGTGNPVSYEELLGFMKIPFDYAPFSAIPINYQYFTQADRNKFMAGWRPNWRTKDGLIDYVNILESL